MTLTLLASFGTHEGSTNAGLSPWPGASAAVTNAFVFSLKTCSLTASGISALSLSAGAATATAPAAARQPAVVRAMTPAFFLFRGMGPVFAPPRPIAYGPRTNLRLCRKTEVAHGIHLKMYGEDGSPCPILDDMHRPAAPPRPLRSPFSPEPYTTWHLVRAALEALAGGALLVLAYSGTSSAVTQLPRSGKLAYGVLVLLALVVRRRFPVGGLLALAALAGAMPPAGLLVAVAAYPAARQLAQPRRRVAVLLTASALTMLVATVTARPFAVGSWQFGLALGSMLAAVTVIVPGLVGTAAGQQDRLVRALRERTAAAEQARRLADSESRIHERSRIAAEMHDLVGHRLSLISLHAGGLELALSQQAPELRDEATLLRKATRDAMNELREVLGVLGPLGRDTGTNALTDATGTRPDIEALIEESRGGGIPVTLDWRGPDLGTAEGPSVRRAVHRVVRESLTNVHRYATGAPVAVTVTHSDERVEIVVRNEAPPEPPSAATGLGTGRGLVGLRERVALLGGTFASGAVPGGGFEVTAAIPTGPGACADGTGRGGGDGGEELPGPPLPDTSAEEGAVGGLPGRIAGVLTTLLGMGGVALMLGLGLGLVTQAQPGPDLAERQEVRVGMSKEEVERSVPLDSDAVRAAAAGREPARPAGTTSCLYPNVGGGADEESDTARFAVTRYCFDHDVLTSVDHFTVPLARP
ncbi:histidine kinase [Streptomyces luteocolor]|uniref:histidine kinase n=2 Tax=Streptomyces TaxID=1883 RepID=UPI001EDACC4E|nr:histidine kinase [Streptomyces luteocolor]